MADKNKNETNRRGPGGSPGNLTGEGSGQQTAGKRGEKQKNKEGKETSYPRSSEEKGQKGRHGGNR